MESSARTSSDPKQKDKTLEYWNAFYSALPPADDVGDLSAEETGCNIGGSLASSVEWIAANSPQLIDTIANLLPSPECSDGCRSVNVLEIGCGVSQLSLSLLQTLLKDERQYGDQRRAYRFVATDISPVCIEHNRKRDGEVISALQPCSGSLTYRILDVLDEEAAASTTKKYDIILDKGTLGTFLFRSKRTMKGSASHPPLLTRLLNNMHRWMCAEGKYVILSPPKFDIGGNAVLVQGNGTVPSRHEVYLYECTKNDSYNPDRDSPYEGTGVDVDDGATCAKCGTSFEGFRGSRKDNGGRVVWERRWKNHIAHCQGVI
ncbi:hypothetical protein ACHAXT_002363 [Thalassiosira profunda]